MNKRSLFIILLLFILAGIGMAGVAFAQTNIYEGLIINQFDSSFIAIMLPAWISLAGSVILLTLALRHMAGGRLASPFILIGFGALIDGLTQFLAAIVFVGLLSETQLYSQIVFSGELLFRLSVVFGVIWIADIFGVLRGAKS